MYQSHMGKFLDAATNGNLGMLSYYIDSVDINFTDLSGKTALWHAAQAGDAEMVDFLLSHHASIEIRDASNEPLACMICKLAEANLDNEIIQNICKKIILQVTENYINSLTIMDLFLISTNLNRFGIIGYAGSKVEVFPDADKSSGDDSKSSPMGDVMPMSDVIRMRLMKPASNHMARPSPSSKFD